MIIHKITSIFGHEIRIKGRRSSEERHNESEKKKGEKEGEDRKEEERDRGGVE